MTDFEWNDEQIAALRKMWSDGLSATKIAAQLGGASRNAVLGKVHRLRLQERAPGCAPKPKTERIATRKKLQLARPPKPTVKPLVGQAQFARKKPDPVKVAEVKSIELRPAPIDMPKPLRKALVDLGRNDCRWPVEGEKSHTLFCGHPAPSESSYCPGHHRLSVGSGTRSERLAIPSKLMVA